jgi:hypothetical protein
LYLVYIMSKTNELSCDCEFDSQIAYLVHEHDYTTPIKTITIVEYLRDKNLQAKIKNKQMFLVCSKKNELKKYQYQSVKRRSHFKHKYCSCDHDNEMTKWHKEWQECFDITEKTIGNRRAGAMVKNNVLEFQYSQISKDNINARTKNYRDNNKQIFWIIECDGAITVEKINNNELNISTYLITFVKDMWKYENFIDLDYIYLNHKCKLFRINPKNVKSQMIEVTEYKTEYDFTECINNDEELNWDDTKLEKGTIYYNQRGAGCGKTYESIQLLMNNKFELKNTFIYLTKMHSAKEVICNELAEHVDKNEIKTDDRTTHDINQHKITYFNKQTGKPITIIIGTIDSFNYAITNKKVDDSDYFRGIVKTIKQGNILKPDGGKVGKNGNFNYARDSLKLNTKCMIVIDEAQDLGKDYIEAFSEIVRFTGIDVYVIGDKLQSIWGEHNMQTFLEKNDLNTTVKKSSGQNHVKRFHNIHFKDFVNNIIDFEKHDLPPIEAICDKKCKYTHDDDVIPYKPFNIPTIYANETDQQKIDRLVEKIIKYMEDEIKKYNYVPKNFMFIFPILAKNMLANRLESRLQDFWIKQFEDKTYRNNVLVRDKHWTKNLNNDFHKYVYLHKSEEGQSINLKESENATRILSIHASKGNGCEVVFVLGLTEYALVKYSKQKCNLVYDSLLHVAITRQKKSLYIGLENNGDDIWKRFNKTCVIEEDKNIMPPVQNITTYVKYKKTVEYAHNDDSHFKNINDAISRQYITLLPKNADNRIIIDWGHHQIRFSVFWYNIMSHIVENEKCDENYAHDQFKTVLSKRSMLSVFEYLHIPYYAKLNKISKNNRKCEPHKNKVIPILQFDTNERSIYHKYSNILCNFIKHIQKKINGKKLPHLCPLETVILMYIIQIMDNGKYAEISIMDIYNIMYCYDECSESIDDNHPKDCLCKNNFKGSNKNPAQFDDIRHSITGHYECINKIKSMYDNYIKYIKTLNDSSRFIYNINHTVHYGRESKNFIITEKFFIIAHSDKHVIYFMIKPQFNKLNFPEVMFKAIFNNFLIKNCRRDKNFERYHNKKIFACIFTFDSEKPIFLNIDVDQNDNLMKRCMKEYLINKYKAHHEMIFDFYQYLLHDVNKPKKIDSLSYTCGTLERNEYRHTPEYIKEFFSDVKKEITKRKNMPIGDILVKVTDKEIFLSEIQNTLESAVNDFIGIDNENNDHDY